MDNTNQMAPYTNSVSTKLAKCKLQTPYIQTPYMQTPYIQTLYLQTLYLQTLYLQTLYLQTLYLQTLYSAKKATISGLTSRLVWRYDMPGSKLPDEKISTR